MPEVPSSVREFPLQDNSIVFIVGAHAGIQAQYFIDTYNPNMYLFEPQKDIAQKLKEQFLSKMITGKVSVFDFALSDHSGKETFGEAGTDACSYIPYINNGGEFNREPFILGELVDIAEFINTYQMPEIDLCLMNCEGSEFILLPYLTSNGLINKFRHLMVQFHPTRKGYDKLNDIVAEVNKTHHIINDYRPQWITWGRK